MRIEHLVITRFSFRGDAFKKRNVPDPLNPSNLELRFKLFEITCLPSILAQTNRNFGWVLITDKDLRADLKERLGKLVGDKKRVYLHEYDPSENLANLDWLEQFLVGTPDYVLTTNVDDDDAIPEDFVSALQSHLFEVERMGRLPPFKIIGTRRIVQWDLITSRKAPLGWKCPWHRGQYVTNLGCSLLCQYPKYNFSVLGMVHVYAENYFDWSAPPANDGVRTYREAFGMTAESNNEDIYVWSKEDTFYDMSKDVGPVLVTNHFRNVQVWRLYEKKSDYEKVVGPETFPDIAVDWSRAHVYAGYFNKRKLLICTLPKIFVQCKRFMVGIVRKLERSVKRFGKKIWKNLILCKTYL